MTKIKTTSEPETILEEIEQQARWCQNLELKLQEAKDAMKKQREDCDEANARLRFLCLQRDRGKSTVGFGG